jgi:hypothetical protein
LQLTQTSRRGGTEHEQLSCAPIPSSTSFLTYAKSPVASASSTPLCDVHIDAATVSDDNRANRLTSEGEGE